MNELLQKNAEREKLVIQVSEIFAKQTDATPLTKEDAKLVSEKNTAIEALDAEIVELKKTADIMAKNAARLAELIEPDEAARPGYTGGAPGKKSDAVTAPRDIVLPARYKNSCPATFRKISDTREDAAKKAFRFGMFVLAALKNSTMATKWCSEHGIPLVRLDNDGDIITRAATSANENVNEVGGFLVPEEMDTDLIQLREEFGVARSLFKRVVMTSDTKTRQRRTGGLKAYHTTDGQGVANSVKGWDRIKLTAEKIMVLALYSGELNEDAIIDVGDDLAREIAWTFALTEDEDAFLGDGTDTYGGFVGVSQRLTDVWGTSGGAGLHVCATGTATNWGNILLSDFNKTKGLLPRYAANANPCWVTTQEFWAGEMELLLTAAGGNRVQDVQNGSTQEMFLGKPVKFAQVMPQVAAASTIPLLYGAFQLGADFGDRRQTTIAMSDQFMFGTDQIAIRGTERYSINVHDVGSQSSNAQNPAQAAPVAGPIVGMMLATS